MDAKFISMVICICALPFILLLIYLLWEYAPQTFRTQAGIKKVPNRTEHIEQLMHQLGNTAFKASAFINYAQNVWCEVQKAWCDRDLTPVQNLMSHNLYNITKKQTQENIEKHIVFHFEDITFEDTYLTSYVRDTEYEYLTIFARVKFIDYKVNERNNKIIKGNPRWHWVIDYKMKFQRSLIQTMDNKFCPNCGAQLIIANSAKCEYCGVTITSGTYNWVLSDFSTVRADTTDDNIRI